MEVMLYRESQHCRNAVRDSVIIDQCWSLLVPHIRVSYSSAIIFLLLHQIVSCLYFLLINVLGGYISVHLYSGVSVGLPTSEPQTPALFNRNQADVVHDNIRNCRGCASFCTAKYQTAKQSLYVRIGQCCNGEHCCKRFGMAHQCGVNVCYWLAMRDQVCTQAT